MTLRSTRLFALIGSFLSAAVVCTDAADRVALVIGNDAYRHARPLKAAVNDASAVGATLQKLGFEVVTASNAGLEQMIEAMELLKSKAAGAKAVLVYYAGHGIEAQGSNYLIPTDAKLDKEVQLRTQALNLTAMLDDLAGMQIPARMIILDCCRDNPLEGRSWLATRSAGGGGLAALPEDELQEATLVVYAASPGKPALDRVNNTDTHSPFTQALLDELPQPGVHSFEVFGRIEERVLTVTDARQKPRIFYNGSTLPFRNFRFATGTAAPAPAAVQIPPAPSIPVPTPAMNVQDTPPPAPAQPQLPAAGFFDLNALFLTGEYSGYNGYSKTEILKRAQAALKAQGFYSGMQDGVPGPSTQRALIAWQQAVSLPVSGRLDTMSLKRLALEGIKPMTAPAAPRPSKPAPQRALTPEERVRRAAGF